MITAEERRVYAIKAQESRLRTADRQKISREIRDEIRGRIRQWRDVEGRSWKAIARQLNDEGVPTLKGGKEWRQSSVQTVGGYTRSTSGVAAISQRKSLPRVCFSCGCSFLSWSNKNLCSGCYGLSRGFKCAGCSAPVMRPNVRYCRQCQNKKQTGQGNGRWKGGRRKVNGYVYVYAPDHPHVNKSKSLPEHVLVVESVIGRYLLPGENVHHKNGVRDDNRPENLELWTRSQPAGQRAIDLLDWAKEVIECYQPIEGQLRLFQD